MRTRSTGGLTVTWADLQEMSRVVASSDVFKAVVTLAIHALEIGFFALILGVVLRHHIAKELRNVFAEALEKTADRVRESVEQGSRRLEDGVGKAAERFADIFQRAVNERMLTMFQDSLRRAEVGVLDKVREIGEHFTVAVIEQRPEANKMLEGIRGDIAAKRYTEAEKSLLKANLNDFEVLRTLVGLYLTRDVNKPRDAVDLLLSKESIFLTNPKFYWQLALAHTELKDAEKAIAAAKRYVELTTPSTVDQAKAYVSLGYTYYAFDHYEPAAENTEKAIPLLHAKDDRLWLHIAKANLAYYLAKLGRQRDRALAYAQEAVAFDKENAFFKDTLGFVRLQFAGNDEAELRLAREEFRQAGELDPTLASAYSNLAEVNLRLKKLQK